MAHHTKERSKNEYQGKKLFNKLCCLGRNQIHKKKSFQSSSLSNGKVIPSIVITKKRKFHILTSVGSNLEILISKLEGLENVNVDPISFPTCSDLPGTFIERLNTPLKDTLEENITKISKEQNVKRSPLLDLSRHSETLSDVSAMTLKDILDHYDTPSTGSPICGEKMFYDLKSVNNKKTRNSSKYLTEPSQNLLKQLNSYDFEDGRDIKQLILPRFFKHDKFLDNLSISNNINEKIYEMVESITLKPIGHGVTSLTSSNSKLDQHKNDQMHFTKLENHSSIAIPPRMQILPKLPMEAIAWKRYRNLSHSIVRTSQGFGDFNPSEKNENEEIYQDIDCYNAKNSLIKTNMNYNIQSSNINNNNPPSSLCQIANKINLKRSFSAKTNSFSHLPTKRSENNFLLTGVNNNAGFNIPYNSPIYLQPEPILLN